MFPGTQPYGRKKKRYECSDGRAERTRHMRVEVKWASRGQAGQKLSRDQWVQLADHGAIYRWTWQSQVALVQDQSVLTACSDGRSVARWAARSERRTYTSNGRTECSSQEAQDSLSPVNYPCCQGNMTNSHHAKELHIWNFITIKFCTMFGRSKFKSSQALNRVELRVVFLKAAAGTC